MAACQETCKNKPGKASQPDSGSSTNSGGGNAGGGNAGSTPSTGAPATVTDDMINLAGSIGFHFLALRLKELQAGNAADINARNAQGRTAFHYAARVNDSVIGPQILGILRQAGAQVSGKDDEGDTPLHYASLAGTTFLLTNNLAKVNEQNNKGETPLYVAAAAGKLSVVQYLLDHGADKTLQAGNTGPWSIVRTKLSDILLVPELRKRYEDIRDLVKP